MPQGSIEVEAPAVEAASTLSRFDRIFWTYVLMALSVVLPLVGVCLQFGVGYGLIAGGAVVGFWAFVMGAD